MERNEGWEAGILSMYLKIQFQMSKSKFLKSCISEGFLPNGVRGCFSLAMDVNNQGLIQSIEEEMDIHSSRLLDRIYIHSQELEIQLKTQRDEMIRTILVSGVLPTYKYSNFCQFFKLNLVWCTVICLASS